MSALPASAPMPVDEALLSTIIAQIAREHGVVLTPHDPLITAVYLNKAILQHYLHGALEPIRHGIADTMTQARQEMGEHTRAQMAYVDDMMLRDREKFVAEQKAALQALDTSLRKRDAGIVKIMADILEKARATFAEEMKQAVKEHSNQGAYNPDQRPKKAKNWAALRALALGIAVGSMGTMATIIILLRLGIVGVVGAGQ